jgi:hypothetical protein
MGSSTSSARRSVESSSWRSILRSTHLRQLKKRRKRKRSKIRKRIKKRKRKRIRRKIRKTRSNNYSCILIRVKPPKKEVPAPPPVVP